jgi:DNA repair protein RadC
MSYDAAPLWNTPPVGSALEIKHRYVAHGIDSLTDVELVELLLNLGAHRRACRREARELLHRYGSFRAVVDAVNDGVTEVKGLGEKNTICLRLFKDAAERYLQAKTVSRPALLSSQAVCEYLRLRLSGGDREMFYVLFLDAKNRVRYEKDLFTGTIDFNVVYVRELFKTALRYRANSLIVAHNHPSGEVEPSDHDVDLTRELTFGCKLLGLRLMDHLIIGDGAWYSFADAGHLQKWRDASGFSRLTG